jgi:hypothetical protein
MHSETERTQIIMKISSVGLQFITRIKIKQKDERILPKIYNEFLISFEISVSER